MATKLLTHKKIAGEGGARGCFFFDAPGSGIVLNVGRSLRSIDRVSAARALGIDISNVYGNYMRKRYKNNMSKVPKRFLWHNDPRIADLMMNDKSERVSDSWGVIGKRFFDVNPWYMDFISCAMAKRIGYDTLQYPYRERHLQLIELVSCQDYCYNISRFSLTGACVGGLHKTDGSDCSCEESRGVLNCDRK